MSNSSNDPSLTSISTNSHYDYINKLPKSDIFEYPGKNGLKRLPKGSLGELDHHCENLIIPEVWTIETAKNAALKVIDRQLSVWGCHKQDETLIDEFKTVIRSLNDKQHTVEKIGPLVGIGCRVMNSLCEDSEMFSSEMEWFQDTRCIIREVIKQLEAL
jgi:hypothetical protein